MSVSQNTIILNYSHSKDKGLGECHSNIYILSDWHWNDYYVRSHQDVLLTIIIGKWQRITHNISTTKINMENTSKKYVIISPGIMSVSPNTIILNDCHSKDTFWLTVTQKIYCWVTGTQNTSTSDCTKTYFEQFKLENVI